MKLYSFNLDLSLAPLILKFDTNMVQMKFLTSVVQML